MIKSAAAGEIVDNYALFSISIEFLYISLWSYYSSVYLKGLFPKKSS
jgi:hypothetical protein